MYLNGGTCSAMPWCSRPPVIRSSSCRLTSSSETPRFAGQPHRLGDPLVGLDARARRTARWPALRPQRLGDRVAADEQLGRVCDLPRGPPRGPSRRRPAASAAAPARGRVAGALLGPGRRAPARAAPACPGRRSRRWRPSCPCGRALAARVAGHQLDLQRPARAGRGVLDDDPGGGQLVADRVGGREVLARARAAARSSSATRTRRRRPASGPTTVRRVHCERVEPEHVRHGQHAPQRGRARRGVVRRRSAVLPSRTASWTTASAPGTPRSSSIAATKSGGSSRRGRRGADHARPRARRSSRCRR